MPGRSALPTSPAPRPGIPLGLRGVPPRRFPPLSRSVPALSLSVRTAAPGCPARFARGVPHPPGARVGPWLWHLPGSPDSSPLSRGPGRGDAAEAAGPGRRGCGARGARAALGAAGGALPSRFCAAAGPALRAVSPGIDLPSIPSAALLEPHGRLGQPGVRSVPRTLQGEGVCLPCCAPERSSACARAQLCPS